MSRAFATRVAGFDRYVFGEVAAARPYLLKKALLALLALDCLVQLVPHGGRYGYGGFNVAHFPVLDRVLPTPTPVLYVGVVLACVLLSLALVLGRTHRVGVALLTALYTFAWSMSLLDAFQHHYLLSLLLASVAFFPEHEARDVFPHARAPSPTMPRTGARVPPRTWTVTSAAGYVSFGLTCAIVYLFTGFTKLEPDFRDGAALRRIARADELAGVFDALWWAGFSEADTWAALARATIALQWVAAAAVLVALASDRIERPVLRRAVALLGLAPVAFHLGAERLDLRIGWFSVYMLGIAAVLFAPAELVHGLGRVLTTPARAFAERRPTASPHLTLGLSVVAAVGVGLIGRGVDLPGSTAAATALAMAMLLGVGVAFVRGRMDRAASAPGALLGAAVSLLVVVAHGPLPADGRLLTGSTIRYDYYRLVGGQHRRRGELREANDAYARALRYAPDEDAERLTRAKLRAIAREER